MNRTSNIKPVKGCSNYELVRSRAEEYPDGHPQKVGGCVGYTHFIQTSRFGKFYKKRIEGKIASMIEYMAPGEDLDLYADDEQMMTIVKTEEGVFSIEDRTDGPPEFVLYKY